MKPYRYDKKVWENGETSRTWQFGIFKGRSFLWVNYENPTNRSYSSGGFHVTLSFLTDSHLFGVELNNNKQCFAFCLMTEYFEGWGEGVGSNFLPPSA